MHFSPDQRALEVLGDYLYELETNDHKRGTSYGQNRTLAGREHRRAIVKIDPPSAFDKAQEYAASQWEREQLKTWKEQGRITEDGTLRVGNKAVEPYTLRDIMTIMPHLGVMDRLATLIILDGVVEEGFMDANENIKEVVQLISREEVERVLQTDAAKARIADIVHEQIGVVFGGLLSVLRGGVSTTGVGKKKNKCGNCGTPGHRAKTCAHSPEDGAAMKAKALESAAAPA